MFTWDSRKAKINVAKHGISFEEAATVFADTEALGWEDFEHLDRERRFKLLGISLKGRVLIVIYTFRRFKNGKEAFRIISARRASRKEREAYFG